MSASSVIYLCINLPQAVDRRQSMIAQASQLDLDIQFVEAVSGKELPLHVPDYDRTARRKCYNHDLTPNEIACALSHKKALRSFLDSSAEYAVIMEDDARLSPHIKAGIHELTHHLHGWEAAKLFTGEGSKLYSLGDAGASTLRAVFPRKILWVAVGWLYSRTAALKLLAGMSSFHLAADQQIGNILLQQAIPTIGVSPSLITSADPHNENSTIDTASCKRADQEKRRSLWQYLRYRSSVLNIALAKKRMIRMMRKRLQRSV